ncbi:acetate/propionate family kinase [Propionivibrio dicarboxylicus]|uniref:Acetate kinase n=1 Tax=Propionivibrio dicarboxylicus TaxID=83767 RepID=A0A1G8K2Q8_9RHOO|nr:acetate kinase [Propionivibrio dicarboxylicus]SDI37693.1 acetate kinase [Propionivibrio dicarboxylicus]
MFVFVLNCGSSSFKYQLLDMRDERRIAAGLVERIGMSDSVLTYEPESRERIKETFAIADHAAAIRCVLDRLVDVNVGVIKSLADISAVGHRVVHGGEDFSGSVLIDDGVIAALEKNVPLAPLHNPPNITGIRAMMSALPGVPNVGVFDTAFHATMPPESYMYAVPYDWYTAHHVRRYGFHGTSHRFVSERAAAILGIAPEKFNCITCHMGNGSSITAIKGGKSYDTSMGMTPLEGIAMGTRSGDVDAGIIKFLGDNTGMSFADIDNALNKQSGLYGVSGVSSDMRDIESAARDGNIRARLAIDVLRHRVLKYVGAYAILLGRVDAVVFTGGIGENAIDFRASVIERLGALGIGLERSANDVRGKEAIVSTPDSRVKAMIVPTNEELVIARDTRDIVGAA